MGEIVYCTTCGDRILASDFEKGRAVVVLKRHYCAKCAASIKEGSPEPPKEASGRRSERRPTVRIPVAKPSWSRTKLMVLLGIAALILLLIIVIAGKNQR